MYATCTAQVTVAPVGADGTALTGCVRPFTRTLSHNLLEISVSSLPPLLATVWYISVGHPVVFVGGMNKPAYICMRTT